MSSEANQIMTNLPVINLRREFEEYRVIFNGNEFEEIISLSHINPVRISNITWHGLPNELMTLIVQRSILGLESYISAAVVHELQSRGLEERLKNPAIDNPFSLNKSAVVALYEKLPGLIGDDFKLSSHDNKLFLEVKNFYKSVRNPIFHGKQLSLSGSYYLEAVKSLSLISKIYSWVDTWYGAFPQGWASE